MKHLMPHIIVLCCMVFHYPSASGQFSNISYNHHHTYTATRNGKEIGWLRSSYYDIGNQRYLMTESNINVQVLFSFEAVAITIDRFIDNIVYESAVHRTLNGKVKLDNFLQFQKGSYKVLKGRADQPITKPIIYTVNSLYFLEPVNVPEIFSEVYLCFLPVKKMGMGIYQTELPDGGMITYQYKNNSLIKMTAKTSYGIVDFTIKD